MLRTTLLALLAKLQIGQLTLTLPDGSAHQFVGNLTGPQATLSVVRQRFFARLLFGGANGFAEAYLDGDCDTPDLAALLELAALNREAFGEALDGTWIARWRDRFAHLTHRNNRKGARRNILAHYDLGNDFYQLWLDPTLTYSSAVFDQNNQPLEAAQANKYRLICDAADILPGQEVLEIGCGWGGFASYAARERQAKITAITISDAQFAAASARMQREGLNERVKVLRSDYRDISGRFDRVASIEMFEAVGEHYWPTYFGKLGEVLKPGGRAALQIITIADALFERYRRSADFIQRHVFPGGMLPSPGALKQVTTGAGLRWLGDAGFGQHYATTLQLWRQKFEATWDKIAALGFDERFRRLWRYYLAYCEAGFRTRRIDVRQIALGVS